MLCDLLFDMTKLTYAALVLGGIIVLFQRGRWASEAIYMCLCGLVISAVFIYVAKLLNK
ncbi:hypothetical protein Barb6_00734 [Bacteroidales bacterium Barb6]|nr:hypothetical protein Barb6_00734 [Bacteroidales bacterium Barb6]